MSNETNTQDPFLIAKLTRAVTPVDAPAPVVAVRRRKRFPVASVIIAAIGQVSLAATAAVSILDPVVAGVAGIGYFAVSLALIGAQTATILEQPREVTR